MKNKHINRMALYIFLTVVLFVSCRQETGKDENGNFKPEMVENPATENGTNGQALPAFKFDETSFNFGTLHSGDSATHIFKFTNTGNAPLLITDAKGSCGCTVPVFSKEPVPAGNSGSITVTYHSSGMAGQISKTVTVLANTIPGTKVLTINAEVIK